MWWNGKNVCTQYDKILKNDNTSELDSMLLLLRLYFTLRSVVFLSFAYFYLFFFFLHFRSPPLHCFACAEAIMAHHSRYICNWFCIWTCRHKKAIPLISVHVLIFIKIRRLQVLQHNNMSRIEFEHDNEKVVSSTFTHRRYGLCVTFVRIDHITYRLFKCVCVCVYI